MHLIFTQTVRLILICGSILTLFCQCALLSTSSDLDEDDPIARTALSYRERDPIDPSYSNQHPNLIREESEEYQQDLQSAISSGELILGMKMNDVYSIWGQPSEIDHAGDPQMGHQRWIYYRDLSKRFQLSSPRIVYFESGRVIGWKTTY